MEWGPLACDKRELPAASAVQENDIEARELALKQCSTYKTCTSCSKASNCGWCVNGNKSKCLGVASVAAKTCAGEGNFAFTALSCKQARACGPVTSCAGCKQVPGCGYCKTTNKCTNAQGACAAASYVTAAGAC